MPKNLPEYEDEGDDELDWFVEEERRRCRHCNGSGMEDDVSLCPECDGTGVNPVYW